MVKELQISESIALTKLRVDRDNGVIEGVKLIGLTSRNGRSYSESALQQAIGLYEGAKVNVNHPKDNPSSPRDYQDRLGVIRKVEMRVGEGLFGNLHFNPKHALSEQLLWDAEHAPENVGLSHNAMATMTTEGDQRIVNQITKVLSVDLVADPATTNSLFESEGNPMPKTTKKTISAIVAACSDISAKAALEPCLESMGSIEVEVGEGSNGVTEALAYALTNQPKEKPDDSPVVQKATTEAIDELMKFKAEVEAERKQQSKLQLVENLLREHSIEPRDDLRGELAVMETEQQMRDRIKLWPDYVKYPSQKPLIETVQPPAEGKQDYESFSSRLGLAAAE